MPLRAVVSITLSLSLGNDISIAGILELDLQVVIIGQFRAVVE